MSSVLYSIRQAARSLRNNPAFACTVVVSLALGIGANTAIFSLIYALLLRQLPVSDPQQLVQLRVVESGIPNHNLSYPVIQSLAAEEGLFAGVGGFSGWTFHLGPPATAERHRGVFVTGGYFSMLGGKPALGRLLRPEDDRLGAAPAAVITFDHWLRRFDADPSIVGRTLLLDGTPVRVIGVSEPGFTGTSVGESMQYTLALSVLPQMSSGGQRRLDPDMRWIRAMARLAPHVSVEQANARLAVLWPPLAETTLRPTMAADKRRAVLESTLTAEFGGAGWSNLRSTFRRPLYVLLGMVGLVLLIACANAANLLLARSVARAEEISVRQALGATRIRIVGQLLTESILLALIAAAGGAVLAHWGSRALVGWISLARPMPVALDLSPDAAVLGFTIALAALTGVLFGVFPALRASRPKPAAAGRSVGVRSRLASGLVVVQMALSLTLLIGAGLFVSAFRNLSRLDPGFRHEGVLMMGLDARRAGYRDEKLAAFYQDLLDDLSSLPGVAAASLSSDIPLAGSNSSEAIVLNGRASSGGEAAQFNRVGPGYFAALGTRLILGRDFTIRDGPAAPPAAIANETFVQLFLDEGDNPIGALVSVPGAPDRQNMMIVGVVEDTRVRGLREPPPPLVYTPFFQHPNAMAGATFSVAVSGSLADVAARMRQLVSARLPSTFATVQPFSERVERSLAQERLLANLATAFGLLALILAVGGLYGLLTYTTTQRRREIGVRMALGATEGRVVRFFLGEAIRLIALGVVLGMAATWVAGGSLSSLLFGLSRFDAMVTLGAIGLLGAAGVAAAILPAYRASRTAPSAALRCE